MDRILRLFPFLLSADAIDTVHFLTLKIRITLLRLTTIFATNLEGQIIVIRS